MATLAVASRPISRQIDKASADLSDRRPVVLAEVRDHLVVGHQPAKQPNDFEIAPGLAFQATARLHAVEIAVDVELEQNRWVVGGPSRHCRIDLEAEPGQI
jgi:hypothetical protein